MTKPRPFDLDRALDEVRCPSCNVRGWTVRVTADNNDIGLFSRYACDECAPMVLATVQRVYPGAGIYPLPVR